MKMWADTVQKYYNATELDHNKRDHAYRLTLLPTASRDTGQNSTFELSNYRTLQASAYGDNPALVTVCYNNCDVLAVLDDGTPESAELMEVADMLENYPVFDDNDLSNLEQELSDEAWGDYLLYDLRHELAKYAGDDTDTEFDASNLRAAAYEVMEELNLYEEWEYTTPYIPGLYDAETLKAILAKLNNEQ